MAYRNDRRLDFIRKQTLERCELIIGKLIANCSFMYINLAIPKACLEMSAKRIAVIGAGPSGLTAVKQCLEYGHSVKCFEKTDDIGGLWRYHDEDIDGLPSVAKNTIINTSKEISAFSDFPPPENFPNYMPHSLMVSPNVHLTWPIPAAMSCLLHAKRFFATKLTRSSPAQVSRNVR